MQTIGYQDNFCDEIIVDNFAGGGGASVGIELALGRIVDAAINHDPVALAMHRVNHPYTRHYCEDIWQVDPRQVAQGRRVALCWLSPDCKHFSRAKGAVPVSKKIRGLAWVACRWAGTVKPRVLILENVPEFIGWGPVKDGKPVKEQAGKTFRSFVHELNIRGYTVEWRILKACDFGAPTIRKRFYLIARCDNQPIVWPKPTHGTGRKAYHTAAECIDWSILCPSIFGRKKELAGATMRRITRGTDKFVIKSRKPYIVQVNHSGEGFRGQSIAEPMQTITAKLGYGFAKPKFAPLVTQICQNGFADERASGVVEPLKTICTKNEFCIAESELSPFIMHNNTNNAPADLGQPLHTVTTGNRLYAAAPVLTKLPYEGTSQVAESEAEFPFLVQYHSETNDTGTRAYSGNEPIRTIDGSNRYGLAAVHIDKYFSGNNQSGSAADDPLGTVTAVDHNAPTAAFLSRCSGSVYDAAVTALANGEGQKDVKTYLIRYSVSTQLGNWPEIRALLNKYCGYALADDEIIILELGGIPYYICDIGLRMLTPRELFLAQGFPPDYVIDIEKMTGKKYSKAKQVARCGNSVCPPVATALVAANLAELAVKKTILTMAALQTAILSRRLGQK